jgi:hypothetical protein
VASGWVWESCETFNRVIPSLGRGRLPLLSAWHAGCREGDSWGRGSDCTVDMRGSRYSNCWVSWPGKLTFVDVETAWAMRIRDSGEALLPGPSSSDGRKF